MEASNAACSDRFRSARHGLRGPTVVGMHRGDQHHRRPRFLLRGPDVGGRRPWNGYLDRRAVAAGTADREGSVQCALSDAPLASARSTTDSWPLLAGVTCGSGQHGRAPGQAWKVLGGDADPGVVRRKGAAAIGLDAPTQREESAGGCVTDCVARKVPKYARELVA